MVPDGLWAKGKMGTCQLSIKKLKRQNKKVYLFAQGRLTAHRSTQTAGTIRVQVGGSAGLVVGGLWAKGKMGTCQLSIKKLKATKEKGVSSAPGGLTGHWRTRSACTIHVKVGGGVGLVVVGLWAEIG